MFARAIPHLGVRRVVGTPKSLARSWSSFTLGDNALTVDALNNTSFPYLWLRDSCQSPECVHPATSQKLHRSSDIPLDIKPIHVKLIDEQSTDPGLRIEWQDGHISSFQKSFLERHISPESLARFHKDPPVNLWNGQILASSPNLFLDYKDLETPLGLLKAIDQLCQYGLIFLRNVPTDETSFEKCASRKLASTFGRLRETFYGAIWNVVNTNSQNIAYTNLKLDLHMDLQSFEIPPRYQILQCIRNRVEGGVSIFVDALHSATYLQNENKRVFDLLASTPVPFQYIHDGHHLHVYHPTIELDPVSPTTIKYVNYGPPFQGPLSISTPPEFYTALSTFDDLLQKPENAYRYKLEEGDTAIFDNRRILHSRTAFKDRNVEGQEKQDDGHKRWLQGCYFESETMLSQGRVLRAKKEKGLI
ncbi:gamma-butyrobetaine hydroxylase [Dendrothele bispora CBS 962.96]|uniref:Gamma-butyrobetaine hydroxylase n=1 Tax=Dendrothele bispora (strain CBS 962.96) TaxID=1314807 RepID=A0A4S8L1H0_DENBC|nr:gamma-butyrobetaine hydroxylase [Dendrothele bispora CBS 962.96]